ncbi:MAG TPA: SufD family Fe-S cluster assembly protein, partial [Candidatus Nanoarchaeia archaeon]|nr:SufD family Fe-S cluster assembly protein [Candidatus Nanoarchaeia archaeon]
MKSEVKGALLRFSIDNITPEKNTVTIQADKRIKIEQAHKQAGKAEDDLMKLHQEHAQHYIITIPRNTTIEEPIVITSKTTQSGFETITIIAEENAAASVFEVADSSETGYCRSSIINVIAQQNAHLQYITANNLHQSTYSFTKKEGSVAKAASIQWIDIQLGSAFAQLKIATHLHEEGAAATNSTGYVAVNNQAYDVDIRTEHRAPRAVSNMLSKGILNNAAKTFIRELIKIHKPGMKSIGHQHQDILLIGDTAKADAIPTLEVDNDDVIASHGTSVGQIDDEILFYAQSR